MQQVTVPQVFSAAQHLWHSHEVRNDQAAF
jgi:hypothetical protein